MSRLFISFYFGLVLVVAGCFLAIVFIDDYFFDSTVVRQDEQRFSAELALLDQLMVISPEADFDKLIQQIAYKNQVTIKEVSPDQIPQNILNSLKDVPVWIEEDEFDYFKVKHGNKYYKMEIDDNHPLIVAEDKSVFATFTFFVFLFAIASYLWIYLLHRKLTMLETAANQFGSGDLSTRVSTENRHKVGQLNQRFNEMASQIEQLIASHQQLTNMVAHELRSPIFRLQLRIEMLGSSKPESLPQHINELEDDLHILQDLVDEFLEYNKLEKPNQSVNLVSTPLEKLVRMVVKGQNHQPHDIECRIDPSVETMAKIDPEKTTRILRNLLENAQKHAQSRILCSATIKDGQLQICVEDDGNGIDQALRQDIFKPFCKLDSKAGYGLGLAICKRLTEICSGDIYADSSNDLSGASFTLSMPIQ